MLGLFYYYYYYYFIFPLRTTCITCFAGSQICGTSVIVWGVEKKRFLNSGK